MAIPSMNAAQSDRAAGVLLAAACGDALGAGYEFGPPMADDAVVAMVGGGPFGWRPGEWTDDTQMSVPILEAAERARREGTTLLDQLDGVAHDWCEWAGQARDVGSQTRAVLGAATRQGARTGDGLAEQSRRHHERTAHTAGNGSLMRTPPVALAHLGDDDAIATAARQISSLTHWDDDAGDACVLWCLAISHAVLDGEFDVRRGLAWLPESRRGEWGQRMSEAEVGAPIDFPRNGWVVHAFQAAWSAIATTPVPEPGPAQGSFPAQHLRLALERAVRAGHDTDTVASIAGALLGARWGSSAVPGEWRRLVHGWPGLRGPDLAARGLRVARGEVDPQGWPSTERIDYTNFGARGRLVSHPHDDGVLLGDAALLDDLPEGVDAIVSLCRVGSAVARLVDPGAHVSVWLIDRAAPEENPNLDFVLADAADTVAAMRAEGRTVLLHCAAAQSRTPTVAAAYSVRHFGREPGTALAEICAALPDPSPNAGFVAALERMIQHQAA
jgi:ADP-ribosylglycohydrolase